MANAAIPKSYSSLPWRHIKISPHPATAPGATRVMILTINRPEKHNAFTTEMEEDMVLAFNLFDVDDRIKAVIVTGAGKYFCTGADLDIGLHRTEGEGSKDHRDG
jgi:enoyl-CoA hydratase/carnithine racemase